VAVTEDLAGDLAAARGRDFDELGNRLRETVLATQEVAEDGLKMAVGEEAARLELGVARRVGRSGHQRLAFALRASMAAALSAPVGSSSCLK
jgi:hypothetical protein